MGGGYEDKTSHPILEDVEEAVPDEGLDDFATLADSYLLSDPGLAVEFVGVDEVLPGSLPKLPTDGDAGRGTPLDPFAWDQPTAEFRTAMWDASHSRPMYQKANEGNGWEPTQEADIGYFNPGKSESPNSGHMSATTGNLQAGRQDATDMRCANGSDGLRKTDESSYIARRAAKDVGQLVYAAERQHLPQSFSRLLQGRPDGLEHPAEAYDRARHPSFSHPACPPSVFASPQSHFHSPSNVWANDMPDGSWMHMRDARLAASPYCSPEGGLEKIVEFVPPDRRHSMGNITEDPVPVDHKLRSRAASSVDDMQHAAGQKVDYSPRLRGSSKHYMPHLSPVFSPKQPSTPSEAFSSERKRKRPADGLFLPTPSSAGLQAQKNGGSGPPLSHISSSSSPTAHDDLVRMLKSQIEGIDSHTKAIMKDTLYRISRNTNTENGGMSAPRPRQSSRYQYLDKLVANFLYNRFEYTEARSGPWSVGVSGNPGDRGYRVSSVESIKPLMP